MKSSPPKKYGVASGVRPARGPDDRADGEGVKLSIALQQVRLGIQPAA